MVDEATRLTTVHDLAVLDTPREDAFDRITALTASLFDVPIALVTIVAEDRIWFKSRHGLDVPEIGREPGLCASAITQDDVWLVTDARCDDRTRTNSLVTGALGLQFYAGAPLRTAGGSVGTLCLIDHEPRTFGPDDCARLAELAALVVNVLEMRRGAIELLDAAATSTDRTAAELQAEVDRRSRAERGQRLLAEVSGLLLHAPSLDVALDGAVKRILPLLGQGSALSRLDELGFRTTHVAHIDPRAVPILGKARDASEEVNLDEAPAVVEHVLATREPLVLTVQGVLTWPGMPEAPGLEEALEALGVATMLIVPMMVRDRPIGTLTCLMTDTGGAYDEHDVQLAQEICDRIAAAIENDRLRGVESGIADALHSSLLPTVLPTIPGVDIAAHYRAAGPSDIGGDFYDVFGNDGPSWSVLLGDVSGKGAEAAAIAGLARYTARALALSDASPRAILERLNVAVERQSQEGKYLTALCATFRPVDGGIEVELADAGHPPALVRRADGTVTEIVLPGTILGMFPKAHVASTSMLLGPGDTLVMYTDGATEARRRDGTFLGLEGFKDALREAPSRRPANIVRRLVQAVEAVDEGRPTDDLALVVLRVGRPGSG